MIIPKFQYLWNENITFEEVMDKLDMFEEKLKK